MLRLFGIELVLQAAWLATMAVFLVTMARLPRTSRIASQVISTNGIAALLAASAVALYAILEGLRGGSANVHGLATFGLAFLITWVPAGLCTSLVAAGVGRFAWAGWALWLALLMAAASQSIPHAVGDWSLRSIAASMACLASALASAHIYGLKKE